MLNLMCPIALVVAGAVAAAGYATSMSSSADRADCPGKIICPLSGELVCEDQCPVGSDAQETTATAERAENPSNCEGTLAETNAIRPDCPGKIVCPLTGELVCEDRCPLGEGQIKVQATPRSCCQNLN